MLPRIKQRQEKLKAPCVQKPFSSLSEDEQAALEAAEYWALARVMKNRPSGNELIAKSVNQLPLAIALHVTEAPEICFKKGICYLVV